MTRRRVGLKPPKFAPPRGSIWADSKGLVRVVDVKPQLEGGYRLIDWLVEYMFVYPKRTERPWGLCTLKVFLETACEPPEELVNLYQLSETEL